MRKTLKILAWVLGIVVLVVAGLASYNSFAPLPTYDAETIEMNVPYDSVHVARGERIAAMVCVQCHRGENGKLEGTPLPEPDFGQFYSGNITNHEKYGLGRYTDAQLVYLLRTGIKPDGTQAIPVMSRFPHMSDDDIYSLVAFLRSDRPMVQASDKQWPPQQPNFLAKALVRTVFKPAPYPEKPVEAPPVSDRVAYGRYMADYVLECYMCHSASFQTNDIMNTHESEGYYGGGNSLYDRQRTLIPSANLTMHKEYGIGAWTKEQFGEAVRFGKRPDGRPLSEVMPKFTIMTDDEVDAIWAYLQTVPVQDNKVERAVAVVQ